MYCDGCFPHGKQLQCVIILSIQLEQKVHSISEELEKVRDEQRAEMSQKDQV